MKFFFDKLKYYLNNYEGLLVVQSYAPQDNSNDIISTLKEKFCNLHKYFKKNVSFYT